MPPRPRLLAGDNPQIPKGAGNAPVRAYLAAIPGWKKGAARQLDRWIVATVPGVKKSVKWNSPFYGLDGESWFLSFHCFAKYIKVTFLRGTSLDPHPPEASKVKEVRYLHVYQDPPPDERQFKAWVRQASRLPGVRM